jgi:hypothetical protein
MKGSYTFRIRMLHILNPDWEIPQWVYDPWELEQIELFKKEQGSEEQLYDEFGISTILDNGLVKIPDYQTAVKFYVNDNEDDAEFIDCPIDEQVKISYQYLWDEFKKELSQNPPKTSDEVDFAKGHLERFYVFNSNKWKQNYNYVKESKKDERNKLIAWLQNLEVNSPDTVNALTNTSERVRRLQAIINSLGWVIKISEEGFSLVKGWALWGQDDQNDSVGNFMPYEYGYLRQQYSSVGKAAKPNEKKVELIPVEKKKEFQNFSQLFKDAKKMPACVDVLRRIKKPIIDKSNKWIDRKGHKSVLIGWIELLEEEIIYGGVDRKELNELLNDFFPGLNMAVKDGSLWRKETITSRKCKTEIMQMLKLIIDS